MRKTNKRLPRPSAVAAILATAPADEIRKLANDALATYRRALAGEKVTTAQQKIADNILRAVGAIGRPDDASELHGEFTVDLGGNHDSDEGQFPNSDPGATGNHPVPGPVSDCGGRPTVGKGRAGAR